MRYFDGLEIGAVSFKWVRFYGKDKYYHEIIRHEGDPAKAINSLYSKYSPDGAQIAITGASTREFVDYPYFTESECIVKTLQYFKINPGIVLSLGGENFILYTLNNNKVTGIHSQSKCAAGTGEFFLQQLKRMNLSLEDSLKLYNKGKDVELASRCSVYFKSDATHKLNKGECSPYDITRSLINNLVDKVVHLINQVDYDTDEILICGGISLIPQFHELIKKKIQNVRFLQIPVASYIEAFGAAICAQLNDHKIEQQSNIINYVSLKKNFTIHKPLFQNEKLVTYLPELRNNDISSEAFGPFILGVDAGSTTTKAVLYDIPLQKIVSSCYNRTSGNPIEATRKSINDLQKKYRGLVEIKYTGVTGSGREIVSLFLNQCYSFNEILAHARAAREEDQSLQTVFEIGGQDSKYINFNKGIPVDYAMNEGCSAGTGSFLEESVFVDMGIPMNEISKYAESSKNPIKFGERCAAFINTNIREALQKGAKKEDVIAGLVYSIAQNYLSKVVGVRRLGNKILFQGGVALNKSVALALASISNKEIIVPKYPELMGSVGICLLINDKIKKGEAKLTPTSIENILLKEFEKIGNHKCNACDNYCEIEHFNGEVKKIFYGGLCSKYENPLQTNVIRNKGKDLIAWRNNFLFNDLKISQSSECKGIIGIPLALTTFELYPFYAKLWNLLGYRVVLGKANKSKGFKSKTTICYPSQIMLERIYQLNNEQVDFIFIPQVVQWDIPVNGLHNYACPSTSVIGGLADSNIKEGKHKFLNVFIDLSDKKLGGTIASIKSYSKILNISTREIKQAVYQAHSYYKTYKHNYQIAAQQELESIKNEPTIVLAARPYIGYSPGENMNLPAKITKRGFHIIPTDVLPENIDLKFNRNVWHYPQQITNCISSLKNNKNLFGCFISCFSCGPDVSLYHSLQKELSDQVYCYLEIDAHTAYAGFDTRLNAFLDIIEENHITQRMNNKSAKHKLLT